MNKLAIITTAIMLAVASPALAFHGGGGGWHGGGGGFHGGGFHGGFHGGGGRGFGPGAAIAGGLLGLGIAGAFADQYYAPTPYYYAPPTQCPYGYYLASDYVCYPY